MYGTEMYPRPRPRCIMVRRSISWTWCLHCLKVCRHFSGLTNLWPEAQAGVLSVDARDWMYVCVYIFSSFFSVFQV